MNFFFCSFCVRLDLDSRRSLGISSNYLPSSFSLFLLVPSLTRVSNHLFHPSYFTITLHTVPTIPAVLHFPLQYNPNFAQILLFLLLSY